MSQIFVNTISPYTGDTVTIDGLVITSNTNMTSLSATTISATTYQNLPLDISVTGGTYNSGTSIITFANNTGGTFTVTGITTSVDVINVSGTTLYSTSPATSEFSDNNSIFFGADAGFQATNASFSNLFGFNVGRTFTGNNIGSNNIIIGTNISLPNTTANAINIGGVLFGTGTYSNTAGNPLTATTANGKIGIQVVTPTSTLDISGITGYNQIRMRTTYTPTGSADTNGNIGDIAWDDNYFYWKTSTQWLRVSGVTW